MSRAIAIYWLIGCLLVGAGAGLRQQRCPLDRVAASDALAEVAIWPAAVVAAAIHRQLLACEVSP